MPFNNNTLDALRSLAAAIASEPGPVGYDIDLGNKQGRIPKDLQAEPDAPEGLRLNPTETRLFYAALEAAANEPEAEHLTRNDVEAYLWRMVSEIFLRWKECQKPQARQACVRSFVEAIRRPHGDYEVLFPITDLQLGTRTLRIGQVAFEQFDREQLGSIGHEPEPLELLFAQAIKEFEGRAVARVHVMAGSQGRAVARAQEAADTALALFRISFHEFRAHIWDEQLLQRRAPVHLVRTPPPKRQILPGWRREFGSLGNLELDDALAAAHDQAVRRFVPALDGSIRGKLGSALIRAVQWMGGSMLRERYDDKVVDLCAALECFLTSQQDRRKGEAIALRSMLLSMALGQGFEHPATTLYLYELRSRVVHGSERDLCGRTDYRSLLGVTYDSLAQAITLIQQRSLTQLSAFLRGLEDESLIKQAHAWIAAQDDEHSQALARFALERLGESSLGRSHGHASRSAGDRRSGQGTAGK